MRCGTWLVGGGEVRELLQNLGKLRFLSRVVVARLFAEKKLFKL